MYKLLIKPIFFSLQPEKAHYLAMDLLSGVLKIPGMKAVFRNLYCKENPSLAVEAFGLRFPNMVGLAAGFDKDGRWIEELAHLGFGFIEVGTVTPKPQPGNPKPRLFRLPQDNALINRMGFNNEGVEALATRLAKLPKDRKYVLGGNIGKNKDTPNENATDDYVICFERLFDVVDYFVVNVSSPNTPGLRALQDKEPLTQLLQTLQQLNLQKPAPKPILLKIAPDLNEAQLDDIVEIVAASGIAGVIATNTTIDRSGLKTPNSEVESIGMGGLSGAPVKEKANHVISYLHKKSAGKLPIIAVGGIATAADAKHKRELGAKLVQVYTGFIYEGPGIAKRILS